MRESDDQRVILDFGNVYILDDTDGNALTSTAVGSMSYIPPEVIANPKERSPLQDIYAAAVLTYELIARYLPDPLDYRDLSGIFGTPVGLDTVLRTAIGPAHKRPNNANALREQLLSLY